jgi:uncharacterized protein (UPF0332 family)
MSEAKSKFDWCLEKAKQELNKGEQHRGLIEIKPNKELAKEHIAKAEHYLKASDYLKGGGYSDISASTLFYSVYHCLLAIAIKLGYESRNQECTFALINYLIETNKISLKKELLEKVAVLSKIQGEDETTRGIREKYQYGTEITLKEEIYNMMAQIAKEFIEQTKKIIETR